MKSYRKTILIIFTCAILSNMISSMAFQVFYEITTFQKLLSLFPKPLISPMMACIVMYLLLRKKLKFVESYLNNPVSDDLEKVQDIIKFIPRFFVGFISIAGCFGVIYGTIGLLLTKHSDVFGAMIYAINIIPVTLIIMMPFFNYLIIILERWTKTIPISENKMSFSLKAKLSINMVIYTFGMMLMIILLNLSLIHRWTVQNRSISINTLILKNSVAAVVFIIVGLSNLYILLIQTINPINQMIHKLKDISEGEGNLNSLLELNSRDESGILAFYFNNFVKKIRDLVYQVRTGIEQTDQSIRTINNMSITLSNSFNDIHGSIEEISKGASSQAQDLSNMNIAMSSFGEDLNNISVNIHEMDAYAKGISDLLKGSNENLESMVASINDMNEGFNNLMNKIDILSNDISQIYQITDVINNMAKQTNLLSLNASIEAAKAGESGKGFAVISSEIRKLAEHSMDASKTIKQLLDSITNETNTVVETVGLESDKLNSQAVVIQHSIRSIREIIHSVSDIVPRIDKVNKLATVLNNNKNEILAGVQQLSAVSGEISSSSEEITSLIDEMCQYIKEATDVSSDLRSMSTSTKEFISRFKL